MRSIRSRCPPASHKDLQGKRSQGSERSHQRQAPPGVRQRVPEVPGTAVSKELTPPTAAALLLDLRLQRTGEQSAAPPAQPQMGSGPIRVAFKHAFPVCISRECGEGGVWCQSQGRARRGRMLGAGAVLRSHDLTQPPALGYVFTTLNTVTFPSCSNFCLKH